VGRLLQNGHRILANNADEETLKELASMTEEQIGKKGWVMPDTEDEGRTLFTFRKPASRL
jgi:Thiolase-like protein type 1 additional C-terminal domain